jgi:hypothetical protein
MMTDLADTNFEERWLDAYAEGSGHCAGYFVERAVVVRNLSGKLWSEGKPGYVDTFCKVLSVSSRTGFYKLARTIMWEVLNDLTESRLGSSRR